MKYQALFFQENNEKLFKIVVCGDGHFKGLRRKICSNSRPHLGRGTNSPHKTYPRAKKNPKKTGKRGDISMHLS